MSNVRHPIKLLAHIRPQSGHIGLHLAEGTMHLPTRLIHPFLQLLRVADPGVNQGSQNCLWVLLRTRGLPFLWRPDRNQWWLLRNIPMQGVLRLQNRTDWLSVVRHRLSCRPTRCLTPTHRWRHNVGNKLDIVITETKIPNSSLGIGRSRMRSFSVPSDTGELSSSPPCKASSSPSSIGSTSKLSPDIFR